MATAVGAAMLLYFVLSRRLAGEDVSARGGGGGGVGSGKRRRGRALRRPVQPPATWIEAVGTLAETLRFTYSETLGKWPIGDLAFGIKYLMRRQVGETENRCSSLFQHRLACRLDPSEMARFGLPLKACVLDLKCEFLCSNCGFPIVFCTAGKNGFDTK